jgi:hypothetical protein
MKLVARFMADSAAAPCDLRDTSIAGAVCVAQAAR